jgi:hypothetical protein
MKENGQDEKIIIGFGGKAVFKRRHKRAPASLLQKCASQSFLANRFQCQCRCHRSRRGWATWRPARPWPLRLPSTLAKATGSPPEKRRACLVTPRRQKLDAYSRCCSTRRRWRTGCLCLRAPTRAPRCRATAPDSPSRAGRPASASG